MLDIRSERRVVDLLGGPNMLGLNGSGATAWIYAIRNGFLTAALDSLGQSLNATNVELAQMLGISTRALGGRRRKGGLSAVESERLLRATCAIARAEDVFDDLNRGLLWLKQPNSSLGGEAPISLLDTEIGARLVTAALGRIEHGVFA